MPRKVAILFAFAMLLTAALAPPARAMDLQRLIAPVSACTGQNDAEASVAVQEQAMRCLSNYARERLGMGSLGEAGDLDRSARDKAGDILRCDSFSHYACGRDFTYWMKRVGYTSASCWRAGENIAWGTGDLGSPSEIFRAWMHSPEHRENILGHYSQIGIGLDIGGLAGRSDAHVWTQHFGSHCGAPSHPAAPRLADLAAARVAG